MPPHLQRWILGGEGKPLARWCFAFRARHWEKAPAKMSLS
jgi:hypothetical protein